MLKAKRIDDWDHTAALMTMIVNALKDKTKPRVDVDEMNPYRERRFKPKQHPFGHLKAVLENNGNSGRN